MVIHDNWDWIVSIDVTMLNWIRCVNKRMQNIIQIMCQFLYSQSRSIQLYTWYQSFDSVWIFFLHLFWESGEKTRVRTNEMSVYESIAVQTKTGYNTPIHTACRIFAYSTFVSSFEIRSIKLDSSKELFQSLLLSFSYDS